MLKLSDIKVFQVIFPQKTDRQTVRYRVWLNNVHSKNILGAFAFIGTGQ